MRDLANTVQVTISDVSTAYYTCSPHLLTHLNNKKKKKKKKKNNNQQQQYAHPISNMLKISLIMLISVSQGFEVSRRPCLTSSRLLTPLAATVRGRDGKIHVGEPEPRDAVGEILDRMGDGLGRLLDGARPRLIPIPIPVESRDLPSC